MFKITSKLLLIAFVLFGITSCKKDEPELTDPTIVVNGQAVNPPMPGVQFCLTEDLSIISDGNSCDIPTNGFICEILEVEEILFLDEEAYDWSPDICQFEVGTQLVFRNGQETTTWDVVDNSHYIAKERILLSCNENYESTTYVCQQNEVIRVSFLCDELGPDTLGLEMRTAVYSYSEQTPEAKENIVSLYQDRNNSNIRNFWLCHFIDDEYDEGIWQSYLEEITLGGTKYGDVVRYQFGDHIYATPHTKLYLQKRFGVLAFYKDGEMWIRE